MGIKPMNSVERKAAIDRAMQNCIANEPYDEDPNPQLDVVNKPLHYNAAGIECIDAMDAMVEGADVAAHEAYCWQNAFKYLWRWPYKNGLEDLKKARWYIDRLISQIERNGQ